MGIRVALTHRTRYQYDSAVQLGPQTVRLRPAPHCRTIVESYALSIKPSEHFLNWQQDPFGNHLARAVIPHTTRLMQVEVRLVVDMVPINPFDFFLEPTAEQMPVVYPPELISDLQPYLEIGEPGPLLAELLGKLPGPGLRTVDWLIALNTLIYEAVKYTVRLDPGVQEPEETLTIKSGSCRDSSWLLVHAARHCGLAARFASGYLIQLASDKAANGFRDGPENDFCDLHAWAEIYLPGAGWVGLDPTSGLFAGEGHIPLACTPMPSSAAAISGGFAPVAKKEASSTIAFEMSVVRLESAIRPTAPITDEQWASILTTGDLVEKLLKSADARLTTGGEPTFISIKDRDAPEWNAAAMGGEKRRLAYKLTRKLMGHWAPGGMLHDGQGKWYPGEPLPRWAMSVYWRLDGEPVWREPGLIAQDETSQQIDPILAERLITGIARRLKVDPGYVLPAYEDAWYYLWREQRLPYGLDPKNPLLEDALERARLARIFTRGLGTVTGYTLPLRPQSDGSWLSAKWVLRAERLTLVPGDSPMGYRLPLDSLPWLSEDERANVPLPQLDPFAKRPPLGRIANPRAIREVAKSIPVPVRTALCVEPRKGTLRVFMPPTDSLESFLEMITAIEDTAKELGRPVSLEGYTPPRDPRLQQFAVTPDPGVIEVNIHPQSKWRDTVQVTETLYSEAAECGLSAEKFLVDGRACGSGGGNHITLGGSQPSESPFLRRPDLLRSLIAYWHNHPSLSYLFSGLFVGPTSQAPRSDEARTETVYELDTALAQLPRDGHCPPWLVDRILRNCLVDVSGNTHRTEICIDKLFSPDSSSGRLGLVELRAFEMPPHARMHVAQQLLVRSLVARLWKDPYRAPLARWGNVLHDRFMLPSVLWEDMSDIITDLKDHAIPIQDEWFVPHREFRFPLLGGIDHHGVTIKLNQALEPWNVLGEESSASGTARFVDSSVERVQVSVSGLGDDRHQVVCNGLILPLQSLGARNERVCGVRFRAWNMFSSLHPTVPVHAPLSIDLIDTWTNRAVAGCTYYVSHPGGLSYDTSPVNSVTAEARRVARFTQRGGDSLALEATLPVIDRDYPFTLDLRRSLVQGHGAAASAAPHGT